MPITIVQTNESAKQNNQVFAANNTWSETDKWWIAIFLGLLFAIFASPLLFGLTNIFIGGALSTVPLYEPLGATIFGLVVHTIIFIFVIRILLW